MDPLRDSWGREIKSVRISVTDKCNFRCTYCMPAEGLEWLGRSEILSFEEIARLVGVLARLGVDEVRLTGGEPLVRRDLPVLVGMLAADQRLASRQPDLIDDPTDQCASRCRCCLPCEGLEGLGPGGTRRSAELAGVGDVRGRFCVPAEGLAGGGRRERRSLAVLARLVGVVARLASRQPDLI